MRLTIKNPETDRLARELAAEMGVTITAAVTIAVRERLRRIRADPDVGVTPASDDAPTRDRDRGRRP